MLLLIPLLAAADVVPGEKQEAPPKAPKELNLNDVARVEIARRVPRGPLSVINRKIDQKVQDARTAYTKKDYNDSYIFYTDALHIINSYYPSSRAQNARLAFILESLKDASKAYLKSLIRDKKHQDAVEHATDSLQQAPHNPELLALLPELLAKTDFPKKPASDQLAFYSELHLKRSNTFLLYGEPNKAKTTLKSALKSDPTNPKLKSALEALSTPNKE